MRYNHFIIIIIIINIIIIIIIIIIITIIFRFLDILADRKARSRVTGAVLYNSAMIRPNFRFSTGYVVQVRIVKSTGAASCMSV